jgi:hypothetical protein
MRQYMYMYSMKISHVTHESLITSHLMTILCNHVYVTNVVKYLNGSLKGETTHHISNIYKKENNK